MREGLGAARGDSLESFTTDMYDTSLACKHYPNKFLHIIEQNMAFFSEPQTAEEWK